MYSFKLIQSEFQFFITARKTPVLLYKSIVQNQSLHFFFLGGGHQFDYFSNIRTLCLLNVTLLNKKNKTDQRSKNPVHV